MLNQQQNEKNPITKLCCMEEKWFIHIYDVFSVLPGSEWLTQSLIEGVGGHSMVIFNNVYWVNFTKGCILTCKNVQPLTFCRHFQWFRTVVFNFNKDTHHMK